MQILGRLAHLLDQNLWGVAPGNLYFNKLFG